MSRFGSLLCLSSLVATLLLCVRINKKGDLAKVELQEAKNAKMAEAEARALLAEETPAVVAPIEAVKAAVAKTWPEAEEVVEKPIASKEFAQVPDAAKVWGIQPWRLAERLRAFVSDVALFSNVWSLGQGGALIIAGKPPTFKPEGSSAKDVKVSAASGQAVKAAEIAETVHHDLPLQVFPHP